MEAIKGIYHPDKVDAESFIGNFSIRLKEFAAVMNTLKKQKKKPLQHFLITGKRGMGKSTLLRRIFLEAVKEPISDKLIAVRLGSEQYKLSRLYKLWEEVIKNLTIDHPELENKRVKLLDEKNYEEHIIHIIVDHLHEQNKTLLLLIDNFDQFMDKLSIKEQHSLRETLIQYPIQVIGNAVFYDEHFFSYHKPFYDFFKPIHLRNLDKEEAEEFIKQLAAKEEIKDFEEIFRTQKSKIDTLRILSGGVPRTLVILLSILSKKNTGDAIDYLNEMLEQVTPLYQDRMKALSSQQQEIMHHLAIHWDRTPVKELAAEMRIPSKSVSAQLSQLENGGYINKISTSGRNLFYEIDERFFNIWLLMSESSAYDVKRVLWLTRWLDMFYDGNELEDYASYSYNKGDKNSMNNLANLYYKTNNQAKKETSLQLVVDLDTSDNVPIYFTTKIEIYLWNEKIEDANKVLEKLLINFLVQHDASSQISESLVAFLVFKQKHLLSNYFEKYESLKDQFKPIYYALMHEMKDEFPDEYLRMTEELAEPVKDTLDYVKKERERLGIS